MARSYHEGYAGDFDELDAFDPLTIQEEWHRERLEAQKWKQENMRGFTRFSLRTDASGVPKVIEFQQLQDDSKQQNSCQLSDTESTCGTSVCSSFQCDFERKVESRQQDGRGQSQLMQENGISAPSRRLMIGPSHQKPQTNAELCCSDRLSKSDHMKDHMKNTLSDRKNGPRLKNTISRYVSALHERAADAPDSCTCSDHLPKHIASRTRRLNSLEFDKERATNSRNMRYDDHLPSSRERFSFTSKPTSSGYSCDLTPPKKMNEERYVSKLFDDTNHTEARFAQLPKIRSRSTGRLHVRTQEKKSTHRKERTKRETKETDSGYMNSLFNRNGPSIGVIENGRSFGPTGAFYQVY